MKKFIYMILVFFAALAVESCTGNAVYLKNDKALKVTQPSNIIVYSITNITRKYEVLGYISTYTSNADRAGDQLRDNLRNQAAQYGADAIIAFKLNIGMGGGGGAQGVAVRFMD